MEKIFQLSLPSVGTRQGLLWHFDRLERQVSYLPVLL